ncbi:MAG: hypothetical protein PHF93_10345 [Acidobacteriota bacterium]|nr:hypothetical protein [Acidobacteriota bacterium]OQB58220.1 MAG: hypothetical protein BWX98_00861 [Candidatus Aminicenantes bacterium ADurb.Bin147]HNQ80248.1 hypothetical protein [Candidatus Aminicenantes bacterium]MDD8030051.1 hypothetical protein [Acidobacteriota bacterium]MDD8034207.1 hypothetical protein [Acidobacteriota bacterium]
MRGFTLVLTGCLFLAGLAVPPVPAADDALPRLVGIWKGIERDMHWEESGFTMNDESPVKAVFEIKEQKGRVFTGVRTWTNRQGTFSEPFSGVIAADTKRLYMVDHEDGYLFADIAGANEIHFYYLESGASAKIIYTKTVRDE